MKKKREKIQITIIRNPSEDIPLIYLLNKKDYKGLYEQLYPTIQTT